MINNNDNDVLYQQTARRTGVDPLYGESDADIAIREVNSRYARQREALKEIVTLDWNKVTITKEKRNGKAAR